jgi:hypothetical protein
VPGQTARYADDGRAGPARSQRAIRPAAGVRARCPGGDPPGLCSTRAARARHGAADDRAGRVRRRATSRSRHLPHPGPAACPHDGRRSYRSQTRTRWVLRMACLVTRQGSGRSTGPRGGCGRAVPAGRLCPPPPPRSHAGPCRSGERRGRLAAADPHDPDPRCRASPRGPGGGRRGGLPGGRDREGLLHRAAFSERATPGPRSSLQDLTRGTRQPAQPGRLSRPTARRAGGDSPYDPVLSAGSQNGPGQTMAGYRSQTRTRSVPRMGLPSGPAR